MTYAEWIKHCEKVILQYNEGAILSGEAFNSILAKAYEVEQIIFCTICGLKQNDCNCEKQTNDTGE